MRKNLFENFIGKQVELFMAPNMPVTSGVLTSCDDDFVVIGDEVWSYKAILGIKPLSTTAAPKRIVTQKKEENVPPSIEHNVTAPHEEEKKAPKPEAVKPQPVPPETPAPSEEVKTETEEEVKPAEIEIPDREFSGILTTYYDSRHWGFIESDDVVRAGIPLRDGKKVFVHFNQITDMDLRKKLMAAENENPNIYVVFKLIRKQDGVAADDVKENPSVKENLHVKIADLVADQMENQPEVGEIDYYRRYENPPYGKIRIAGNQLFHFEDIDVIDPVLAVFLEVSPSAEGQAVKFIRKKGKRGAMKAANVEAAEPFPEEKLKSWADLIEKAKKRMEQ